MSSREYLVFGFKFQVKGEIAKSGVNGLFAMAYPYRVSHIMLSLQQRIINPGKVRRYYILGCGFATAVRNGYNIH